jgi:RsiW-degrading membrane proteinase PrsW (M82 family)
MPSVAPQPASGQHQAVHGYASPYPYGYAWPGYSYAAPYPSYYPYGYGYSPPPWVWARPPKAPGETYAQVIGSVVLGMGVLSILLALLAGGIAALIAVTGNFDSLPVQDILLVPTIAGLAGGGFAIYYGIRALMRSPSPRFTLPRPLLFVGLTALVLVVAIVQWHLNLHAGPGPAIATFPLVLLSGVLPALAILSFASWRMHLPGSRRHVWMSFFYGVTLAPLLALIGEIVFSIILGRTSPSTQLNPNDPARVIRLLVEIAVSAPLIEEGVKPLAAILIMPRLRTAASAFLVGMAGGIGFDMFETTFTYIGTGEADWVQVAFVRVGAGLLHGLGAGMVALGWYYFINGRGVHRRWLKGVACIVYAVVQHAVFNGSAVLVDFLPGPVEKWLGQVFYIGQFPVSVGYLPFFGLDALILVMLIFMTGRLLRASEAAPAAPPAATPAAGVPVAPGAEPAPVGGAA